MSRPTLEQASRSSYYDAFGPASNRNLSQVIGTMDQDLAEKRNASSAKVANKVTTSRIRVLLSRPLTWAEKEAIETNHDDIHSRRIEFTNVGFKLTVSENREHVWVEAGFGSRLAFDLVSAVLEQHFVNVYPKAVRTFREYNGE